MTPRQPDSNVKVPIPTEILEDKMMRLSLCNLFLIISGRGFLLPLHG